MYAIRYIQHNNIDFARWDACIVKAPNGLLYAQTYFLDQMSPGWDALVLDDYKAVMPLTHRKKWGVAYLFQPSFCAELGVFSETTMSQALTQAFLKEIPASFRYIDICLNRSNHLNKNEFPYRSRRNYILPLTASYASRVDQYALNHRRNIKKAVTAGLYFDVNIPIEDAIDMIRKTIQNVVWTPSDDWKRLASLFNFANNSKNALCVGVKDAGGMLLSVALFFRFRDVWYYLAAGSTEKGRKTGAAHFLIDQFIALQSGNAMMIDFEGSDVESLAFFYRGFGADAITYPALLVNRLPRWLRWIKKG